jgi:hypothetical protein
MDAGRVVAGGDAGTAGTAGVVGVDGATLAATVALPCAAIAFAPGSVAILAGALSLVFGTISLAQYLPMPTVPGGSVQFCADAAMHTAALNIARRWRVLMGMF